uniref:PGG domain-containing protein n=1 Tax=Aegilops tauschii subsp. strangulata TaxID=200361 RepID=A0A453J3R7_AEGTS
MVDLLLQWRPALGSDLDINKSSPLHFASSDGDCSVIEKIITHSPPNTTYLQDSEGLSALSAAALMGHVSAVRLLLRFHPACADVRDNHGRTFLHAAAMKGHSSIVSYVIKDIMLEHLLNTQDNEGNTPLHLAVVAGEHKVIYKLLSSGKVRAHIMNDAGCTPSDLIENSTGFYSMDIMKWRETTSKNIAVVSTLVATVAFSAAFNVPGSYGSSGKANLSGHRRYDAFMVLDTIAMTTSVIATILLIYGRASRSHRSWLGFMVAMHFLWLSLNSMMLAFFTAMVAVMREKNSMKVALTQVIYNGLYILMTLLANLATPRSLLGVMQLLVGSCFERRRRAKRRISRQFPFVIFYALNVVVFIVVNTLALSAIQVTG